MRRTPPARTDEAPEHAIALPEHKEPGPGRPAGPLGILLLSAAHDRSHFAFMTAAAAAALGRSVLLFASNSGCRALRDDWSHLEDSGRDAAIRRRGVAGLGELREAARELGVRMIACEAGLRAEAIDVASLWSGVEVAGLATFLEAIGGGQVISL
jgi:predicted peroxiredoxin